MKTTRSTSTCVGSKALAGIQQFSRGTSIIVALTLNRAPRVRQRRVFSRGHSERQSRTESPNALISEKPSETIEDSSCVSLRLYCRASSRGDLVNGDTWRSSTSGTKQRAPASGSTGLMTTRNGCEGITIRLQLVRAGRRVRRVLRIEQYNVLDHGAAGIRETRESELGYEGVSRVAGTRKTDATYWLVAGNARESLPG